MLSQAHLTLTRWEPCSTHPARWHSFSNLELPSVVMDKPEQVGCSLGFTNNQWTVSPNQDERHTGLDAVPHTAQEMLVYWKSHWTSTDIHCDWWQWSSCCTPIAQKHCEAFSCLINHPAWDFCSPMATVPHNIPSSFSHPSLAVCT